MVKDVLDFFQEVDKKSLNALFITPVPKKIGARSVRDFRPIGLVGSVY